MNTNANADEGEADYAIVGAYSGTPIPPCSHVCLPLSDIGQADYAKL